MLKFGTISSVEVRHSDKTDKDYSVVTIEGLPDSVRGVASAGVKVGDLVVYHLRIDDIEKVDERS